MITPSRSFGAALLAAALLSGACSSHAADPPAQGPSVVKVVKQGDGWQLIRNGQPYVIKGAGGSADKALLKNMGANSFRTWGADNIQDQLDEAQKLGLTVTVGIWLGHKEHGFSWHNQQQVDEQFARAQKNIQQYKNDPALLIWALGNEMETNGVADDPALWEGIEKLAAMAHREDPNHPTMTVVAEIGGNNVQNINKYCPDIDIIGINSYAGAQSLPERYKKAGGVKPYVVTEFGPPGTWEFWKKTSWGAMDEFSSTEKVEWYKKPYEANVLHNSQMCLGAYAFTWGSKQEASATWYGMLLPDGSKLGAVDGMSEEWTGKPAPNPVPVVEPLKIDGPREMDPNTPVTVHLAASDPQGDPLKVHWILTGEPKSYNTGGATEAAPPTYPNAIVQSDNQHADLKIPDAGRYRLFAYVYNNHGGAAMANLALLVKGADTTAAADGNGAAGGSGAAGGTGAHTGSAGNAGGSLTAADNPGGKYIAVYSEADQDQHPWTPSGYMGNTAAVHMDDASTDNPHSGKTCLKVQYDAGDNWAGVVWQDPANDWGKQPGGHDLTGATKLTFWARGAKGDEVVSFSFGLLAADAKYHDTAKGELKDVRLSKEWRQYSIDLAGKDLTDIKTGFCWVTAGQGAPVTFYLDDIHYEGIDTVAPPKITTPAKGDKVELPLVVYAEAGQDHLPWIPSGYMGNTGAIKMDDASTDNPHSGKTCLKVQYTAGDNWGGVVWQDPANDWGTQPGGHDLTGATKLTFWARGENGGETVSFSFGLLDAKAKYHDTDKGELKDVQLTKDWKQYTIDLAGKDLSDIKTGFVWTLASKGAPVTFYLDDIKYE